MSGYGHNSESFGELLLTDEVETVLADDTKKLFHYVQWHLADYITGTQGMSPEQEGIYIRFLVRLYDRGKPFRDDDKQMAMIMSLDVRRWRRVKEELVTFGKITIRSGGLTNSRFEKERLKRAAELRRQADATQKYWDKKRAEKGTSEESRGEVGAKSEGSRGEVQANSSKKSFKINETDQHPTMQTRDQRLEIREERKKEDTPPPSPPVTARESGGGSEISGLNGATNLIISKLAGWINPIMPDTRTARTSVENFVGLYGSDVVRDAFAKLEAKMLHGDIVARPIPYLAGECGRIKSRKAAAAPSRDKIIFSGVR